MDNKKMTTTQQDSHEQQEQHKPQEPPQPKEKDPNKLTIEINRFQNLLEILNDRKKVFRLSIIIILVGLILFLGITKIVVAIKRLYPYNDITTNVMGTTTLRSESKDVSYFLLNSSELWANSGIQVKKGQTITIKSSGKKHSAIHHLVNSTQYNQPGLTEPWVGSEGFPEDFDTRDQRDGQRARHRIFPNTNQDILLMQIVPDGVPSDRPDALIYNEIKKEVEEDNRKNQCIVVGNKMDNIHINMDGVLYFAINDIVLDDESIIKMLLECDNKDIKNYDKIMKDACVFRDKNKTKYDSLSYCYKKTKHDLKQIDYVLKTISKRKSIEKLLILSHRDSLLYKRFLGSKFFTNNNKNQATISLNDDDVVSLNNINSELISLSDNISKESNDLYEQFKKICGELQLSKNKEQYGPFMLKDGYDIDSQKIELYGYFMNKFKEAWYEDNVGSFLILVEKVND